MTYKIVLNKYLTAIRCIDDEDDLMDKEMYIFKVDYVRALIKKSIQTNTHKLIKKAKANIHAVEKGMFEVGH